MKGKLSTFKNTSYQAKSRSLEVLNLPVPGTREAVPKKSDTVGTVPGNSSTRGTAPENSDTVETVPENSSTRGTAPKIKHLEDST